MAISDFLRPLEGCVVDDHTEDAVAEERESLAHGDGQVTDVRIRLIKDPAGNSLGRILVVAFPFDAGSAEAILGSWYGNATGRPTRIRGVELTRIRRADVPDAAEELVLIGPSYIVRFSAAQELSGEWLEQLAGTTIQVALATEHALHQHASTVRCGRPEDGP